MNSELIQIPFGRIVTATESYMQSTLSSSVMFDAVYIPSLGQRIPSEETLYSFQPHCKEYVFLFSDSIPDWFEKIALDSSLSNHTNVRAEIVQDSEYSSFYTGKVENQNVSIQWRIDFDIPLKRSYALYDARRRGYRYIGMIDDDIHIETAQIVNAVYALDQGNCVVGFHVDWYPDKCTLDHVKRELTKIQESVAMTGSVLFLDVDRIKGDFPLVYNEDLFFFLQQPDFNCVVSGGIIHQKEYESWKTGERVMHEQFGELVYTAILSRLKSGWNHGEITEAAVAPTAKAEFLTDSSEHINWDDELATAMKRVEDVISLDNDGAYASILKKALMAIKSITTENIRVFVDAIPFSDIIKNFV